MEALTRPCSFEAPSPHAALTRSLLTGAFVALFVPMFTLWFDLGAA